MAKKLADMYENKKGEKFPIEGNVLKVRQHIKPTLDNAPENLHQGHRERLRQRFLSEGLENFQDHNILELLLFYSIPMKDTNEEAHNLMNAFGSLVNVFDADYEDLCKVKGIGERSALLIKLMPELFRKYEMDKLNDDEVILNNAELIAKYVSGYFKGLTEERLYLLCLDTNCKFLKFELISSGTVNATMLNNRKIAEIAFETKSASVVLVHNHPSGVTAPSRADIDATVNIISVMNSIGIKLNDHIIIGHGDEFFSFRRSDKWKSFFK